MNMLPLMLEGSSISPERTEEVIKTLLKDASVSSIHDVKSVMVGPGVARFKAEVHLNPRAISNKYLSSFDNLESIHKDMKAIQTEADTARIFHLSSRQMLGMIASEVDRLEDIIRREYPEFRYIDLELL